MEKDSKSKDRIDGSKESDVVSYRLQRRSLQLAFNSNDQPDPNTAKAGNLLVFPRHLKSNIGDGEELPEPDYGEDLWLYTEGYPRVNLRDPNILYSVNSQESIETYYNVYRLRTRLALGRIARHLNSLKDNSDSAYITYEDVMIDSAIKENELYEYPEPKYRFMSEGSIFADLRIKDDKLSEIKNKQYFEALGSLAYNQLDERD